LVDQPRLTTIFGANFPGTPKAMTDERNSPANHQPPGASRVAALAGLQTARWVSLALGWAAIALIFMVPALRAEDAGLAKRAGLAFFLVGAVGALAHGMDLTPRLAQLRVVMRPDVAWPAIVLGGLLAWLA
jgi:hypothetical protein